MVTLSPVPLLAHFNYHAVTGSRLILHPVVVVEAGGDQAKAVASLFDLNQKWISSRCVVGAHRLDVQQQSLDPGGNLHDQPAILPGFGRIAKRMRRDRLQQYADHKSLVEQLKGGFSSDQWKQPGSWSEDAKTEMRRHLAIVYPGVGPEELEFYFKNYQQPPSLDFLESTNCALLVCSDCTRTCDKLIKVSADQAKASSAAAVDAGDSMSVSTSDAEPSVVPDSAANSEAQPPPAPGPRTRYRIDGLDNLIGMGFWPGYLPPNYLRWAHQYPILNSLLARVEIVSQYRTFSYRSGIYAGMFLLFLFHYRFSLLMHQGM
jgi:hypothetical protein